MPIAAIGGLDVNGDVVPVLVAGNAFHHTDDTDREVHQPVFKHLRIHFFNQISKISIHQSSIQSAALRGPIMGIIGVLNHTHGGWEGFAQGAYTAHDATVSHQLLHCLNGAFNIDLSGASTTSGATWDLITTTGAVTIGSTFTLTGFTADAGAVGVRKWTSGDYQFDEATGILTRIVGIVDTGTDGMADSWESTYFLGLGQLATGDFDHDGTDNLTDYRLQLTPNSGTSRFAATRAANGLLTWPSAVGLTFMRLW